MVPFLMPWVGGKLVSFPGGTNPPVTPAAPFAVCYDTAEHSGERQGAIPGLYLLISSV